MNIRDIRKFASTADGRAALNVQFNLCAASNISKAEDLGPLTAYLTDVYGNLAMANYPYANEFLAPLPAYPVREFCARLADVGLNDTQLLRALQSAVSVYANHTGAVRCLDVTTAYDSSMGDAQWQFQTCTDMVMPMCSGLEPGRPDMFPRSEWNIREFSDECFRKFGVRPQENAAVTTYGGPNLE